MPEKGVSEEVNAPETLLKGMVFKSKVDLKNVVKSYSILLHQHIDAVESNKKVWAVKCKKNTTNIALGDFVLAALKTWEI